MTLGNQQVRPILASMFQATAADDGAISSIPRVSAKLRNVPPDKLHVVEPAGSQETRPLCGASERFVTDVRIDRGASEPGRTGGPDMVDTTGRAACLKLAEDQGVLSADRVQQGQPVDWSTCAVGNRPRGSGRDHAGRARRWQGAC